MRIRLSLLLAILSGMCAAQPQGAPTPTRVSLPCDTQAQAKSGNLYRIATPTIVYVNCDNLFTQFTTTANLYALDGNQKIASAAIAANVVLFLPEGKDSTWLKVTLPATSPLQGNKSYRLVVAQDGMASVGTGSQPVSTGPFNPATLDISTAPAGTISPSFRRRYLGATFRVNSNIALCGVAESPVSFAELGLLNQKVFHKAAANPSVANAPECEANHSYPNMPVADDPGEYGSADVTLVENHLRQASATIQITGFRDIFGEELALKGDVSLGGVPKTKDAASWYFQFSHQAGPGSLPGWVSDVKLAPQIGHPLLGGFFWRPALNMDIGGGTVTSVKANDTITASLGLTRLVRTNERGLEAVRFTPAASYETNREFNQQNLISDLDFAFSFSDLSATRLERSWAIYNKLKTSPKPKFSAQLASFGASLQFFLGSEIGHSILSQTVKASKSTASVVVPPYTVARLRPRTTASLEYRRLTLSFTAAARYLFVDEWVTRQSTDGKSIRLDAVSGFRPYGEAGIKLSLDQAGHIALNSTYKLGSQPPTFQYVNSVQSGVLFIY